MMEGMSGFGFGMGLFGWVFMALILGLIIFGIFALINWSARPTSGSQKKKTPLEILKDRYAHGDIDEKEFEHKKHTLQG